VGHSGLALNDQMLLPKRLPLAAVADVVVIDSDAIAGPAAAGNDVEECLRRCP
jgi:hypothetical protein